MLLKLQAFDPRGVQALLKLTKRVRTRLANFSAVLVQPTITAIDPPHMHEIWVPAATMKHRLCSTLHVLKECSG